MMKRRELIQYAGAGLLAAVGTSLTSGLQGYQAQSSSALSVQWLGHTCFLFVTNGLRILVNPFRQVGCTAGYRAPKVTADLVLISSQLLDEGEITGLPGNPKILYDPGVYEWQGMQLQGIAIDHDRAGGRQFGTNIAWRWTQADINILHLGGAAAPIAIEQKILMNRPDLVLIPVGGSGDNRKAYNAEEAKAAVEALSPKLVIPTHYRTRAADAAKCDIVPVDGFLKLMKGQPIRRTNSDKIELRPGSLPKDGYAVQVLSYRF